MLDGGFIVLGSPLQVAGTENDFPLVRAKVADLQAALACIYPNYLPALAIGDLGVVDPGDQALAVRKSSAIDGDALSAELVFCPEQRPGSFVQLSYVPAPTSNHHRVLARAET